MKPLPKIFIIDRVYFKKSKKKKKERIHSYLLDSSFQAEKKKKKRFQAGQSRQVIIFPVDRFPISGSIGGSSKIPRLTESRNRIESSITVSHFNWIVLYRFAWNKEEVRGKKEKRERERNSKIKITGRREWNSRLSREIQLFLLFFFYSRNIEFHRCSKI